MKTIDTLIADIEELLVKGGDDIPEKTYLDLGQAITNAIRTSMSRDHETRLRMSNIGQCSRKTWYGINAPDDKEPLKASAYLKFMFGHILEEVLLFLAEAAGHSVEGRQDEQEIAGIKGHRDAVIDGVLTDVKSASTYSFKKFETHLTKEQDSFGYLDQIQSYLFTGQKDPLVTDKSRAAFLVVDKTLGNICLDIHPKEEFDFEKYYEYKKDKVNSSEPPARQYDPVPDGKSGNMKLDIVCSYCEFKNLCHPGLRTFIYAAGPRYLTTVKKEPDVPEAK